MQQVPAWKASDGEIFPTEDACRGHELRLKMASAIQDPAGVDFVCMYPQPVFDMMWDVGYRRGNNGE